MFLEVSTIPHHSDVFWVRCSTSLGLCYIRKDLKLNLTEKTLYLNLFGFVCDHDCVDFPHRLAHRGTLHHIPCYEVGDLFLCSILFVIFQTGFINSPTTNAGGSFMDWKEAMTRFMTW
ncbi:unnamed protein product [Brassica rapa]|uniref:Uncharacterized protein n=1 Tax=Brassica campestris TaxID=3711 RepID=A0A3P5ZAR5_BRACM|nr:unnamed protein product [Brassica rapa]VDC77127.1 unnamed protein product [Brassica rapa]